MDCINPCNKNQTAKVLERFFYVTTGRNYTSAIPDEADQIEKLPTLDEIKENTDRAVTYAKEIILNADKFKDIELDENVLKQYACGLDPLLDKILAINIADILDRQRQYSDMEQLKKVWIASIDNFKTEWNEETKQGNTLSVIRDIDTSQLTIGLTVKNYKVMCELLSQPEKGGKARKLQLEDWKIYFDWEKSGQKFIITDIYDTPLTKEDKRKLGNNSIYVKYIEVGLLQYLSTQQGFTRTLTKRNWWWLLGIVNDQYGKKTEKELTNLDYTVTPWEVKHFYQRCNKKLEEILFSALNSLKSRKLITYEIQTMIVKWNPEKHCDEYFEATDNQKRQILEVEHYVLHNIYKYEKMIQIFLRFQQQEYYQKVNELLYEYYGWDHCFKQIKIIYTPEGVREAYPELEAKLQKELLNEKICEVIDENAKNTFLKWQTEYKQWEDEIKSRSWVEDGKIIPRPRKPFKPNVEEETYLGAQNILKNELIKIGHKDMVFSTERFLESNDELDSLFDFTK